MRFWVRTSACQLHYCVYSYNEVRGRSEFLQRYKKTMPPSCAEGLLKMLFVEASCNENSCTILMKKLFNKINEP